MRVADRLAIPERYQVATARALELALVGFVFVGLYEGEPGVVVNSGVALLVCQLPALLERNYEIVMDSRLVLWLTLAVFLHALGVIGLPGGGNFYRSLWWWDHLTHTLSSSVVAGSGYALVRAVDEHVDGVEFPPTFVFVTILSVVVAFGVVWEVLEFAIGLGADVLGAGRVLTQYGLDDSMLDLLFDVLGGLVVAVWGTAYLSDVAADVTAYFETRTAGRNRE